MNEKNNVASSAARLKKLEGILAYCEAAHLPRRAQHVLEKIDAETKRLEQLKEEARLDPEELRKTQLLNQCQHCLYHRFWGACALSASYSKYFGTWIRFEQQCIMEQGHECSCFRPTNASPYYWEWLSKHRIMLKRQAIRRANELAAQQTAQEPKRNGKRKKATKRPDPMQEYIKNAIDNI